MRIHGVSIAAALLLTGLAACNTVQGMGKDIQGGGGAITESSEKVQQDMKN